MPFPNLFIVGAPKAATTTLHDVLSLSPQIYMSDIKEPHFFSDIGDNVPSVVPVRSEGEYLRLFSKSNGFRYRGESSVSYLYDVGALKDISRSCPSPKIIVMLREPVSRTFSHWLMDYREGVQKKNFREAVIADFESSEKKGFGHSHMYLECSQYSRYVKDVIEIFGGDSVYFGFFEDFIEDPRSFLDDLSNWLGLPDGALEPLNKKSNPAGVPRNGLVKLLFHNFYLRRLFKAALPKPVRIGVRQLILKKPDSGLSISDEDRAYLKQFFVKDVEILKSYVPWSYEKWDF